MAGPHALDLAASLSILPICVIDYKLPCVRQAPDKALIDIARISGIAYQPASGKLGSEENRKWPNITSLPLPLRGNWT